MASYSEQDGKPLPKFGDWDVNDPASAEGFTVIFNKARDEKKIASASGRFPSQRRYDSRGRNNKNNKNTKTSSKKKWFCFSA
ncbi:protein NOI4-like [Vicia villosa]|uniref:protein NOI4-like n=1 Tax=Vicia villosa TaxID=3911 RepID=UPI00273C1D52|nr:protein NOI4-like [Vicia villosa]